VAENFCGDFNPGHWKPSGAIRKEEPVTQFYPQQVPEKRVNGLGVAGFICGIFALLFAVVPFCGFIPALVFAIIGGILAFVGLLAAISDKRTGVAFPMVGIVTCLLAIGLSVFWTVAGVTIFGKAISDAQKQAEAQQRAAATRATTQSSTRPSAPAAPKR
jgi:hypothetical protein